MARSEPSSAVGATAWYPLVSALGRPQDPARRYLKTQIPTDEIPGISPGNTSLSIGQFPTIWTVWSEKHLVRAGIAPGWTWVVAFVMRRSGVQLSVLGSKREQGKRSHGAGQASPGPCGPSSPE